MFARISLVALAALTAGCLKDLSQVDLSTSGPTTEGPTTDTSSPTSTTDGKAACGDGELDPGEQCDDGNTVNGDGCENNCTKTPGENCGNGVVDEGEECDDGNKTNSDGCENNCTETVVSASCGDGVVNGDDECDDGNKINDDACTNTCKHAVCGDGIVHAGVEDCDDGDDNSDTIYNGCTKQCQLGPHCGDGVVQAEEECDDGTPDGDDLCNNCINTPRRYVFVTSQKFNGKTNGLNGADSICGFAALQAELGADNAKWVAWLSDDMLSPFTRMDKEYTGWYALRGAPDIPVAKGWSGLTSGALLHPINRTETGDSIAPGELAWANTKTNGGFLDSDQHCGNWASNSSMQYGRVGDPHATDSQWTVKADPATCNTPLHLYCVEN